jgi:hypothetical protein
MQPENLQDCRTESSAKECPHKAGVFIFKAVSEANEAEQ